MLRVVEPSIKREFQEVSLLAIALCRAPSAFPVDRASLQSLVSRINRARETDSPRVHEGAPEISPHPPDELWIWLSLGEDGSIQLTAFQGVGLRRVTTRIKPTGEMGPCVAETRQLEEAGDQDLKAPQGEKGDSSESTQAFDEDEDSRAVRAAEDLIFAAALVIMASAAGVPETHASLEALGGSIHEKLQVPVMLAEESRLGYDQSGPQWAPMHSRQDAGKTLEIGPIDGTLIHIRANVLGRQCSAWLTGAGRLVDLGVDLAVKIDPDVGTTK